MSVTFTFGQYVEDEKLGTVLWCGSRCDHRCTTDECEDAVHYGVRSCEHAQAARDECGCEKFDVNLSNVNAIQVLERLGFSFNGDDELCGDADPADFLARAMLGNVGRDDSGTPDEDLSAPGSARFIACGVEPGYFAGRLEKLAELATEAQRRGMLITWS